MKPVAFLMVLLVILAFDIEDVSPRVVQIGSDEFLSRLAAAVDGKFNFLLKFIIPQIPNIYPLDGPIKFSVPGVITMDGSLKNAFVTGIPKTKADISINAKDAALTFALSNEYMKLFGREYDIAGLYLVDGARFNGSGVIAAELKNLDFFLSTKLVVDAVEDQLSITKTNIDVSFESFLVELENLEVNGVPVNWKIVNHKINKEFNGEWPKIKTQLIKELENEVNKNLQGLSLEDILRLLGA